MFHLEKEESRHVTTTLVQNKKIEGCVQKKQKIYTYGLWCILIHLANSFLCCIDVLSLQCDITIDIHSLLDHHYPLKLNSFDIIHNAIIKFTEISTVIRSM